MTLANVRNALASGRLAVSFLTIVPVRARSMRSEEIGSAAAWFPLVGAAVGAVAGGVRAGVAPLVGQGPATVVALIVGIVLTGGLHQDGLADAADGLGARGGPARGLEAMRDSATGAFGALALIAWAFLVVTTVAQMSSGQAVVALTVAAALGRLAAVGHALACRPARSDGLSAAFRPTPTVGAVAAVTGIGLSLGLAGPLGGAAALGAGALVCLGSVVIARRRFGGRTGDTLGATVCLTEAVVCLTLLGVWHG